MGRGCFRHGSEAILIGETVLFRQDVTPDELAVDVRDDGCKRFERLPENHQAHLDSIETLHELPVFYRGGRFTRAMGFVGAATVLFGGEEPQVLAPFNAHTERLTGRPAGKTRTPPHASLHRRRLRVRTAQ